MILKNRKVKNPNEFQMLILNMTGDYIGTINTMKVKIDRDEGDIYEEGTSLDAQNLSLFCKGYYLENESIEIIKNQDINDVMLMIETNQFFSIENINPNNSPFVFTVDESSEEFLKLKLGLMDGKSLANVSAGSYKTYFKLIKNIGNLVVDVVQIEVVVIDDSVSAED